MELVLLMVIRAIIAVMFFRMIFDVLFFKSFNKETNPYAVDAGDQGLSPAKELDDKTVNDVIDPVCRQTIKKDDAYIISTNDSVHYFCSWECRQKYVAEMNHKVGISG